MIRFFEKLANFVGGDMSYWETHTPQTRNEVDLFHETRNIHFLVADLLPVLLVIGLAALIVYTAYRILMWRLDKLFDRWEAEHGEFIESRAYEVWRVKGFDPRKAHPLLKLYFFVYRRKREEKLYG